MEFGCRGSGWEAVGIYFRVTEKSYRAQSKFNKIKLEMPKKFVCRSLFLEFACPACSATDAI